MTTRLVRLVPTREFGLYPEQVAREHGWLLLFTGEESITGTYYICKSLVSGADVYLHPGEFEFAKGEGDTTVICCARCSEPLGDGRAALGHKLCQPCADKGRR